MELRLKTEIAAAQSRVESECKRAELAAYRARLGRLNEAREAIAAIRQRNEPIPHIRLSVWIHLAEGLVAYFDAGGVSTTDGVQRAHALSVAAGLQSLRALSAAWLAQWGYMNMDVESLARHACEALRFADSKDHSARSRASLVIAQALHLAQRMDLAQAWYSRAKVHATVDFDDATIGALMHNMASLRGLALRQRVLSGKGEPAAGQHALMNAESTDMYSELVGDASFLELRPILRAYMLSLEGDAEQAVKLYDEHFASAKLAARLQSNFLADKAWCHVQLGQVGDADECATLAISSLSGEMQPDDLAAAHSRLAQVFGAFGKQSKASEHSFLANLAWNRFAVIQARVLELLSNVDENGQRVEPE